MNAFEVIQKLLSASVPTHPTLEEARLIYAETGMCWWPNTWCCNGQVGSYEMFACLSDFVWRVNNISKKGQK